MQQVHFRITDQVRRFLPFLKNKLVPCIPNCLWDHSPFHHCFRLKTREDASEEYLSSKFVENLNTVYLLETWMGNLGSNFMIKMWLLSIWALFLGKPSFKRSNQLYLVSWFELTKGGPMKQTSSEQKHYLRCEQNQKIKKKRIETSSITELHLCNWQRL